ncbi:hypothetical protein KKB99_03920 [bacterium]|nr:hypothetical protein [bacterium]MBU1025140.1 hypothetical protein [bacterium]
MKSKTILFLTLMISTVFIISCSAPAPQAYQSETDTPVDITAQAALPVDQTSEPQAEKTTMKSFKTVAPEDIPKCLAQIETVKTILEKTRTEIAEFGATKYLFKENEQVFLNTKPMTDNGGLEAPIPLFTSWDNSKIEGLDQVECWVSGNSAVKIKGIRRADDGNWYNVSTGSGTLNELEGWIHEKFLASYVQLNPSFKGVESPPDEGGGDRPRGGRRGGGGRGPGGGGG